MSKKYKQMVEKCFLLSQIEINTEIEDIDNDSLDSEGCSLERGDSKEISIDNISNSNDSKDLNYLQ